jgi:hypothetical protein
MFVIALGIPWSSLHLMRPACHQFSDFGVWHL